MKSTSKRKSIIVICAIIALVFLCGISATYSYFTASKTISGEQNLKDLDVYFIYQKVGDTSADRNKKVNSTSLRLIPDRTISRGDSFNLKSDTGELINYIGFGASDKSCSYYVRFRVDAYIVTGSTDGVEQVDTTVNYGQYFELYTTSEISKSAPKTNGSVTNVMYYTSNAVDPNTLYWITPSLTIGGTLQDGIYTMKLLENAPVDLLNQDIQLTISFEAAQSEYGAYQAAFNDGWGYLDSWT